jgi:hypothetical protein
MPQCSREALADWIREDDPAEGWWGEFGSCVGDELLPYKDAYLNLWGYCKVELYMSDGNIPQIKKFSRRWRALVVGKGGARPAVMVRPRGSTA